MITPKVKDNFGHVWHQYTVRLRRGQDRDKIVRRLDEAGIETGIYYPIPVHEQPYIKEICGETRLRVSEQMAREVISLPVHSKLSTDDLETIVEEVNKL
jgi:dTDP-4-amino-4,6-dideoxygalactose transaminase